jgi:hypothetical protein
VRIYSPLTRDIILIDGDVCHSAIFIMIPRGFVAAIAVATFKGNIYSLVCGIFFNLSDYID